MKTDESRFFFSNVHLMKNKILELDLSFEKAEFAPAKSFFLSRDDIQNSEVFKFIRGMPKGAALHTHHISLGPIPWVVSNLTYRDNLYMRLSKEKVRVMLRTNPTTRHL